MKICLRPKIVFAQGLSFEEADNLCNIISNSRVSKWLGVSMVGKAYETTWSVEGSFPEINRDFNENPENYYVDLEVGKTN